jgi:hypothetical protein
MKRVSLALAALAAVGLGDAARANSTVNGAAAGAVGGALVAGPVGLVVGGVGGAIIGSHARGHGHARRVPRARRHRR